MYCSLSEKQNVLCITFTRSGPYTDYLRELGQVNSLDSLPSLPRKTTQIVQNRAGPLPTAHLPQGMAEAILGILFSCSGDNRDRGLDLGPATLLLAEALQVLCFIYHFYISLPRRMGSKAKHTKKCLNHRPSGF